MVVLSTEAVVGVSKYVAYAFLSLRRRACVGRLGRQVHWHLRKLTSFVGSALVEFLGLGDGWGPNRHSILVLLVCDLIVLLVRRRLDRRVVLSVLARVSFRAS